MASQWRIWLGAGALALGAGTALAIGSGVAHADNAGTGSSGTAHHQKRTTGPAAPRSAAVKVAKVRTNAVPGNPLVVQDKAIAEQHKAIAEQAKVFGHDARVAVFDFTSLPPEVNSSRIYSGAGSSSLISAASAWNGLADELNASAQGVERASQGLSSAAWAGPVAGAMAASTHAYAGWLNAASQQAENAASQASAVANAFETAFAAGVPPQVTAANRAQLVQLTASNFFSGNLPAIAATEAMLAGMWAQDVAALVSLRPH